MLRARSRPAGQHLDVSSPHPRYAAYNDIVVPALAEPFFASIVDALAHAPEGLVVDLATGTGATGRAVTVTGRHVWAIDQDPLAVSFVRYAGGVDATAVASADALPCRREALAAIVVQQGAQFFGDYGVVATEAARVLRPGGVLVTVSWTGDGGLPILTELDQIVVESGIGDGPRWEQARSFDADLWNASGVAAGLALLSSDVIERRFGERHLAQLVTYFIDDQGSPGEDLRRRALATVQSRGTEIRHLTAWRLIHRKGA